MKKTTELKCRLSPLEKELLVNKSKESNISQSEFIRKLIRGESIVAYKDVTDIKKLINETNRIGTNINQIVHNVNMGKYSDYEKKKLFTMMQVLIDKVTELTSRYYDNPS